MMDLGQTWSLNLVTPPAFEPIDVDRARQQCRLDGADDDMTLTDLISVARAGVEAWSGQALPLQTFRLTLDQFPRGAVRTPRTPLRATSEVLYLDQDAAAIKLPRSPVVAVTEIRYLDAGGVEQVLSPTRYRVDADSRPARIDPAWGTVWPATLPVVAAVKVTFQAGYATAAAIPPRLRQAVAMEVERLFVPGMEGPSEDAVRALCNADDVNVTW